VIVKSLMAHDFDSVSDRYDELNKPQSKSYWAGIAAAGIHERLVGDVGARKGLDEAGILKKKEALAEAQSELAAAQERAVRLDTALAAIEDGKHRYHAEIRSLRAQRVALRGRTLTLIDSGGGTDGDYRRIELERDQIEDEIERLRDELQMDERRLNRELRSGIALENELERRVRGCENELKAAVTARVPLAEDVAEYDLEARLRELLDGVKVDALGPEEEEIELLRHKMTPPEFAEAMGIPYSSFTRQMAKALASVDGFAFAGGADNPRQPIKQPIEQVLEVHGPKKRYIVFDALDLARYHPDQIRRMKLFLSRPFRAGEAPEETGASPILE
jgi:hypothetical protein